MIIFAIQAILIYEYKLNLGKNIVKIAKEVLLNESRAISQAANFIDEGFAACVQEIFSIKGRVVITGIGKSAIIANKIVATMNSTGTPAVFMHAGDAIHGDLGMIQSDDLVICISKSGNTPEIKVLVPLLKRRGSKLVALVSNTESYLASHADYVLNGSIEKEACPNNLAPTTSTTVHLALGDALAICLLELRQFSSSDFAQFHPGGALGKQLYLKVDDLYVNNEVPVVKTTSTIREIILEISTKRLGATAVVDDSGKLCGIITDGDLRRTMQQIEDISHLKAKDIMGGYPKTIEKGSYAVVALEVMQKNGISQVIITSNETIEGFVHLQDLLKEGII